MAKKIFTFLSMVCCIFIFAQTSQFFSTDSLKVTHRNHPVHADSVITKIDVKFIYYTTFNGPKTVDVEVSVYQDPIAYTLIKRLPKERAILQTNNHFIKYSKELTLAKNTNYFFRTNMVNVNNTNERSNEGSFNFYTYVGLNKIAEYNFNNTNNGNLSGNGAFQDNALFTEDRFGNAQSVRTSTVYANLTPDSNFNLPAEFKPRSYSMWIKKTNYNSNGNLLYKFGDASNLVYREVSVYSTPYYLFSRVRGFTDKTSSAPHNDSFWYHYVITFDGIYHKIYRNGQLVQSENYSFLNIPTNAVLQLGEGSYDDIQIYEGILEPQDVIDLYNDQNQNAILSVKNTTSNIRLRISPNPTSDQIKIEGSKVKSGQIINANGSVVKSFNTDIVDVSKLSNGIYFVVVEDVNNQKTTQKLIKK